MDYGKFTLVTRGKGQQLSRDDFITYDDVYNIWYKVTTAAMRKDSDPVLSAMKWMEEFENNGGFTFYDKNDKTNGLYFGFASLWQLQQLKTHGRTICFDGTHNVFGFFRADIWEHQANFQPEMLKPDIKSHPDDVPPEIDQISFAIQRLNILVEPWDTKAEYPQRILVQTKLQEALDLFEASFLRYPGQNINGKRSRRQ
ncbi:hypothetical protein FBU30_001113 [Linnemannia zychae]|nr:hypothetical protein FBU30_001113 [Linnemannia zychae]